MGDPTKSNVPGQGLGQPAAPASVPAQPVTPVGATPEPAGQQGTTPQYVTRDEALLMIQSFGDKNQARVNKQMQKFEESLETIKKYNPVTPEQEQAMRARAFDEALKPEAPAGPIAPGTPVQGQSTQLVTGDPIQADVQQIQQAAGVTLVDGDPEVATLVFDKGPYAYLKSVETAVLAKKVRTTSATTNPPETPGNPAARMPVQGSPAIPHYTPEEKIAQGLKLPFPMGVTPPSATG